MRRLIPILLLALAACAQTKTKGAFDKTVLENYVRHLELFVGNVKMKIDDPQPSKVLPGYSEVGVHLTYDGGSKDEVYYVSQDGQTLIQGGDPSTPTIFNIAKSPFQPALDKLHTEGQPSFGPANAPVTIVEFGDLECPSCKAEAPALRELLPQFYKDKVRVVFKDFPLESIHPWARAASDAARCVFHQNKETFWKFYDWMYETQEQVNPDNLKSKVMDWAKMNGIDTAKLGTCIDTKATDGEVAQNMAEGRALGVHGTPSLFIDGRRIGGVDFQVLQQIIDEELKYQAKGKP
jgi:protein-disulfide isomerase